MKAHEKLALAIKEQRELLLALTRARDGGLDEAINTLQSQVEAIQERMAILEGRRQGIDESIAFAEERLSLLLGERLVDSKPDLKKLVKMAKQMEKFAAECKEAGIDPSSLLGGS